MARVWYRAVTGGLLLIRRLRPIGEPAALRPLESSAAATMDGTAGAGRIVYALAQVGISCDPVVQLAIPADIEVGQLGSLVDERDFDAVALGSHLVNVPDEERRRAFLGLAARHLAAAGTLVVEHHPIDWAETAADVEPTPGSSIGMEEVRRDPPFVHAVSVFDVGGRTERQPFTARVLSDAELSAELEAVGLRVTRRLGPTWLEAAKAGRSRGLDMQDLRSGHAI
jgi:hypothetical protein